jgi:hypothetical protein
VVERGDGHILRMRVLTGWLERLRGLLGTRRDGPLAEPVVLVDCGSVHTLGMAYEIDVALLGADGSVVKSRRGVPPGRVVGARGASLALERPSALSPWPTEGQRVTFRTEGPNRAVGWWNQEEGKVRS